MTHTAAMERARVALDGLSVGDAFGERFFVRADLVERWIAERATPPPVWAFTDDTAMALSVVDVLQAHGTIDRDALARAFADRFAREPWRGYGGMAHRILASLAAGAAWHEVSPQAFDGQGSKGNGAAMRAAPLGAYFAGDPDRAADEARRSAEVTHAHAEGIAGAVAVAVMAALAADAKGTDLLAAVLPYLPPGPTQSGVEAARRLPLHTPAPEAATLLGSGTRVLAEDTVPFSLWCAARHLDAYEDALWATVSGLGDRDTTCAIVGGIVASRTGRAGIPAAWLSAREPIDC